MRIRSGAFLLSWLAMVSAADLAAAQSFGAKGGVTLADVSFDQDRTALSTSAQPGFVAGGLINFPLFGRFGLQAEGLYSKRVTEFEGFIKDSLTYVELPVLLRYPLTVKPAWRVHVLGGVVYSRLIEAREKFSGNSDDITDLIEPNDLAASVGADVEWKRKWVFDFRYLYGLSEVYIESGTLFSARQKVIQITAGYRFR